VVAVVDDGAGRAGGSGVGELIPFVVAVEGALVCVCCAGVGANGYLSWDVPGEDVAVGEGDGLLGAFPVGCTVAVVRGDDRSCRAAGRGARVLEVLETVVRDGRGRTHVCYV
jgi:hypothetical protein